MHLVSVSVFEVNPCETLNVSRHRVPMTYTLVDAMGGLMSPAIPQASHSPTATTLRRPGEAWAARRSPPAAPVT